MAAVGPKGRPAAMQLVGGAVLLLMVLVITYMYRVIDTLHREQQAMRLQIAELTGTGYSSSPHLVLPRPRSDIRSQPQQHDREPSDDSFQQYGFAAHRETFMQPMATKGTTPDPRKLMGLYSTGTTAGVGCWEILDVATKSYDVSSATGCQNGVGNTFVCPDCFVTPQTVSQDIALTIQGCSAAKWVRGQTRSGVWLYTFINTHSTRQLSVTDNGGGQTYNVPPSSFVQAYCTSVLGTANRLHFPSTTLPTLAVDNSITLSSGNFDASASTGTFATSSGTNTLNGNTVISGSRTFTSGTGIVTLNGATSVADGISLTVGTAGNGGATTFHGSVTIGAAGNGQSVSTNMYGDFTQHDDGDTTAKAFSTASGTVSLNGHTTVASGKNLHMTGTGSGTFETGTGAVTLNGHTTITSSKQFATGTGGVSLNGDTTVTGTKTFTVGAAGSAGQSTLYGDLVVGAAGNAASATLYGDFSQLDHGGSAQTFTTASGTVTINGHTTVTSGKNLHMAGSGTFQSGTGAVSLNGNTAVTGSKTFATGTGQVSLNGAVQVADSMSFTMGTPGAGGEASFYGDVKVGSSQDHMATTLTVYGDVSFNNDGFGTTKTFSTATGQITLNGDVTVATNKHLLMTDTGTGTFQTGLGPVYLNGDTEVKQFKTFKVATYTNDIECVSDGNVAANNYCRAAR